MKQKIFMVKAWLYRDHKRIWTTTRRSMTKMRRMRIGHGDNKYYEDDCEDTNQHTKLLYIQRFISFIQKLIIRRIGVSDNKNDEDAYSTLMRIRTSKISFYIYV
jgi:hypothetical protein